MAASSRADRLSHEQRWFRAKLGPTTTLAFTNATARTSALEVGFYRLSATQDVHVRQGDSTVTAATTDYPLYIGQEAYTMVDTITAGINTQGLYDGIDQYIAAIRDTADGSLSISLIDRIDAAVP